MTKWLKFLESFHWRYVQLYSFDFVESLSKNPNLENLDPLEIVDRIQSTPLPSKSKPHTTSNNLLTPLNNHNISQEQDNNSSSHTPFQSGTAAEATTQPDYAGDTSTPSNALGSSLPPSSRSRSGRAFIRKSTSTPIVSTFTPSGSIINSPIDTKTQAHIQGVVPPPNIEQIQSNLSNETTISGDTTPWFDEMMVYISAFDFPIHPRFPTTYSKPPMDTIKLIQQRTPWWWAYDENDPVFGILNQVAAILFELNDSLISSISNDLTILKTEVFLLDKKSPLYMQKFSEISKKLTPIFLVLRLAFLSSKNPQKLARNDTHTSLLALLFYFISDFSSLAQFLTVNTSDSQGLFTQFRLWMTILPSLTHGFSAIFSALDPTRKLCICQIEKRIRKKKTVHVDLTGDSTVQPKTTSTSVVPIDSTFVGIEDSATSSLIDTIDTASGQLRKTMSNDPSESKSTPNTHIHTPGMPISTPISFDSTQRPFPTSSSSAVESDSSSNSRHGNKSKTSKHSKPTPTSNKRNKTLKSCDSIPFSFQDNNSIRYWNIEHVLDIVVTGIEAVVLFRGNLSRIESTIGSKDPSLQWFIIDNQLRPLHYLLVSIFSSSALYLRSQKRFSTSFTNVLNNLVASLLLEQTSLTLNQSQNFPFISHLFDLDTHPSTWPTGTTGSTSSEMYFPIFMQNWVHHISKLHWFSTHCGFLRAIIVAVQIHPQNSSDLDSTEAFTNILEFLLWSIDCFSDYNTNKLSTIFLAPPNTFLVARLNKSGFDIDTASGSSDLSDTSLNWYDVTPIGTGTGTGTGVKTGSIGQSELGGAGENQIPKLLKSSNEGNRIISDDSDDPETIKIPSVHVETLNITLPHPVSQIELPNEFPIDDSNNIWPPWANHIFKILVAFIFSGHSPSFGSSHVDKKSGHKNQLLSMLKPKQAHESFSKLQLYESVEKFSLGSLGSINRGALKLVLDIFDPTVSPSAANTRIRQKMTHPQNFPIFQILLLRCLTTSLSTSPAIIFLLHKFKIWDILFSSYFFMNSQTPIIPSITKINPFQLRGRVKHYVLGLLQHVATFRHPDYSNIQEISKILDSLSTFPEDHTFVITMTEILTNILNHNLERTQNSLLNCKDHKIFDILGALFRQQETDLHLNIITNESESRSGAGAGAGNFSRPASRRPTFSQSVSVRNGMLLSARINTFRCFEWFLTSDKVLLTLATSQTTSLAYSLVSWLSSPYFGVFAYYHLSQIQRASHSINENDTPTLAKLLHLFEASLETIAAVFDDLVITTTVEPEPEPEINPPDNVRVYDKPQAQAQDTKGSTDSQVVADDVSANPSDIVPPGDQPFQTPIDTAPTTHDVPRNSDSSSNANVKAGESFIYAHPSTSSPTHTVADKPASTSSKQVITTHRKLNDQEQKERTRLIMIYLQLIVDVVSSDKSPVKSRLTKSTTSFQSLGLFEESISSTRVPQRIYLAANVPRCLIQLLENCVIYYPVDSPYPKFIARAVIRVLSAITRKNPNAAKLLWRKKLNIDDFVSVLSKIGLEITIFKLLILFMAEEPIDSVIDSDYTKFDSNLPPILFISKKKHNYCFISKDKDNRSGFSFDSIHQLLSLGENINTASRAARSFSLSNPTAPEQVHPWLVDSNLISGSPNHNHTLKSISHGVFTGAGSGSGSGSGSESVTTGSSHIYKSLRKNSSFTDTLLDSTVSKPKTLIVSQPQMTSLLFRLAFDHGTPEEQIWLFDAIYTLGASSTINQSHFRESLVLDLIIDNMSNIKHKSVLDALFSLVTLLGTYSINVRQLKTLFALLKTETTEPINTNVITENGPSTNTGNTEIVKQKPMMIQSDNALATFPSCHSDNITMIAYSPNTNNNNTSLYYATSSKDHTIHVWDTSNHTLIHTFSEHTDSVNFIQFIPNSDILLSASNDKTCKIFNLSLKTCIFTLSCQSPINALTCSSCISCSFFGNTNDNVSSVKDSVDNMTQRTNDNANDTNLFAASDYLVATALLTLPNSTTVDIYFWSTKSNQLNLITSLIVPDMINFLSFSPDNSYLTTSSPTTITQWECQWGLESSSSSSSSSTLPDRIPIKIKEITSIDISCSILTPNSKYFIHSSSNSVSNPTSSTSPYTITLRSLVNEKEFGKVLCTLNGHDQRILGFSVSLDSKYLISTSSNSIILWNLLTRKMVASFEGTQEYPLSCAAFSPDSKSITSGTANGSLKIWENPVVSRTSRSFLSLYIINSLAGMTKRTGPTVFFDYDGINSELIIKKLDRWPSAGFSFCTWFRIEELHSPTSRQQPRILSLLDAGGCGIEVVFDSVILQKNQLYMIRFKIINLDNSKHSDVFQYCFSAKQWYFISITTATSLFREDFIILYVNGEAVDKLTMKLPSPVVPLTRCRIGATSNSTNHKFHGQMGTIYFFDSKLTPDAVTAIYQFGPNYMSTFELPDTDEYINPNSMSYLGPNSPLRNSIWFSYNCKSVIGSKCYNSAPEILGKQFSRHATVLGMKQCLTSDIKTILHCIGGVTILLPLLAQADLPLKKADYEHSEPNSGTVSETVTVSETQSQPPFDIFKLSRTQSGQVHVVTVLSLVFDILYSSRTNQAHFLRSSGFRLLSYLLQRINSIYITKPAIQQLFRPLSWQWSIDSTTLLVVEHLTSEILLNFNILSRLSPSLHLWCLEQIASGEYSDTVFLPRLSTVDILAILDLFYDKPTKGAHGSGSLTLALTQSSKPLKLITNQPNLPPDFHQRARKYLIQILAKSLAARDYNPRDIKSLLVYFNATKVPEHILDLIPLLIGHDIIPAFLSGGTTSITLLLNLVRSTSESIRVKALAILGPLIPHISQPDVFLCALNHVLYSVPFTTPVYHALFNALTQDFGEYHMDKLLDTTLFLFPPILKTIFSLLSNSGSPILKISVFQDIDLLLTNSQNVEIFIAQKRWQEWILELIPRQNVDEANSYDLSVKIFVKCLHYALVHKKRGHLQISNLIASLLHFGSRQHFDALDLIQTVLENLCLLIIHSWNKYAPNLKSLAKSHKIFAENLQYFFIIVEEVIFSFPRDLDSFNELYVRFSRDIFESANVLASSFGFKKISAHSVPGTPAGSGSGYGSGFSSGTGFGSLLSLTSAPASHGEISPRSPRSIAITPTNDSPISSEIQRSDHSDALNNNEHIRGKNQEYSSSSLAMSIDQNLDFNPGISKPGSVKERKHNTSSFIQKSLREMTSLSPTLRKVLSESLSKVDNSGHDTPGSGSGSGSGSGNQVQKLKLQKPRMTSLIFNSILSVSYQAITDEIDISSGPGSAPVSPSPSSSSISNLDEYSQNPNYVHNVRRPSNVSTVELPDVDPNQSTTDTNNKAKTPFLSKVALSSVPIPSSILPISDFTLNPSSLSQFRSGSGIFKGPFRISISPQYKSSLSSTDVSTPLGLSTLSTLGVPTPSNAPNTEVVSSQITTLSSFLRSLCRISLVNAFLNLSDLIGSSHMSAWTNNSPDKPKGGPQRVYLNVFAHHLLVFPLFQTHNLNKTCNLSTHTDDNFTEWNTDSLKRMESFFHQDDSLDKSSILFAISMMLVYFSNAVSLSISRFISSQSPNEFQNHVFLGSKKRTFSHVFGVNLAEIAFGNVVHQLSTVLRTLLREHSNLIVKYISDADGKRYFKSIRGWITMQLVDFILLVTESIRWKQFIKPLFSDSIFSWNSNSSAVFSNYTRVLLENRFSMSNDRTNADIDMKHWTDSASREMSMIQYSIKMNLEKEVIWQQRLLSAQKKLYARDWKDILRFLRNDRGPWRSKDDSQSRVYYTLDLVEDHVRRRHKLKIDYDFVPHINCARSHRGKNRLELVENENDSDFTSLLGAVVDTSKTQADSLSLASSLNADFDIEDLDDDDDADVHASDSSLSQENILISTEAHLILPLEERKGLFTLYSHHFIFTTEEPSEEDASGDGDRDGGNSKGDDTTNTEPPPPPTYLRMNLDIITGVQLRRYRMEKTALEIFSVDNKSIFIALSLKQTRNIIFKKFLKLVPQTSLVFCSKRTPSETFKQSHLTHLWENYQISNFEYLMHLNTIAGRSYNDISQYPVFPWIITDFTSSSIDLNDPSIYRDLSYPIGAQTPQRRAMFQERYEFSAGLGPDGRETPRYHYGTHYSNPAIVINYMIRVEPFTSLAIKLQGTSGHFDHPDRMFHSIPETWNNINSGTSDVKELIPEFFYFSEFLTNINNVDFGIRETDNLPIDAVVLPPWAKSPQDFVMIMRQALESAYVSANIHKWIDLIFGERQTGPLAVESVNVFHPLTYENAVDFESIENEDLKRSYIGHLDNFGQVPCQLLTRHHPKRPPKSLKKVRVFDNLPSLSTFAIFLTKFPTTFIAVPVFDHLHYIFGDVDRIITIDADRVVGTHSWSRIQRKTASNTGSGAGSGSTAGSPGTSEMSPTAHNAHNSSLVDLPRSNSSSLANHDASVDNDTASTRHHQHSTGQNPSQSKSKSPTNQPPPGFKHSKSPSMHSSSLSGSLPIEDVDPSKSESTTPISTDSKNSKLQMQNQSDNTSQNQKQVQKHTKSKSGSLRNTGLGSLISLSGSSHDVTDASHSSSSQIVEKAPFDFILDPSLRVHPRMGVHFSGGFVPSPKCFSLTKDGKVLLSCGYWDNSFKLFLIDSAKEIQSVVVHKDIVTCLSLGQNGTTLVTGSKDATVIIWELEVKNSLYRVKFESPIAKKYQQPQNLAKLLPDLTFTREEELSSVGHVHGYGMGMSPLGVSSSTPKPMTPTGSIGVGTEFKNSWTTSKSKNNSFLHGPGPGTGTGTVTITPIASGGLHRTPSFSRFTKLLPRSINPKPTKTSLRVKTPIIQATPPLYSLGDFEPPLSRNLLGTLGNLSSTEIVDTYNTYNENLKTKLSTKSSKPAKSLAIQKFEEESFRFCSTGHLGIGVSYLARESLRDHHDLSVPTVSLREISGSLDDDNDSNGPSYRVLHGHVDEITDVAVSTDLDLVVSTSLDGTAIIHSLRTGEYIRTIYHPNSLGFHHCVISSECHLVLYSKDDRQIFVHDINGNILARRTTFMKQTLSNICVSNDSDYIITAGSETYLVVRKLCDLKIVHIFNVHKPVRSLTLTSDEQYLLVGLQNGMLLVFTNVMK